MIFNTNGRQEMKTTTKIRKIKSARTDLRGHNLRVHRGISYLEYVLTTLVLVVMLFIPPPGLDHSIVDIVMESIRDFNRNTTYLLSLP